MPDPTTDVAAFLAAALRDGTAREVGVAGLGGQGSQGFTSRGPPPPPPPDGAGEKVFQDAVRLLARWGGWEFNHDRDSRGSDPDWPDCVCVRNGRLVVAELKVKGRKATPGQERVLAAFALVHGCTAGVFYPEDWDRLVELLR